MTSLFSNLVHKLFERIYASTCKFEHGDKKCETREINYKHCDCFREFKNFKDDLIEQKGLCCNKNYEHKLDEKLKKQFFNTYTFFKHDNNKFILLL